MEKSNCCTAAQASDSNCCTTNQPTVKKKIGTFLMGLALVFAVSSAFKNASGDVVEALPPSIEDFDWIKTDKKVVYLLLEGKDAVQNRAMTSNVETVVNDLNDTDGSAHFKLVADENTQELMQKTAVEKTPSVVVLGRGTAMTILSESVSIVKLFKAYITATTPISDCSSSTSCSAAKKSSCCSKKSQ